MNKKNYPHLLLIAEDARIAHQLQNQLEAESFKITLTRDFSAARKVLSANRFTAILHSSTKNDAEALLFFKFCREQYSSVPLLVLSNSTEAIFAFECAKSAVAQFYPLNNGFKDFKELILMSNRKNVPASSHAISENSLDSIIGQSKAIQELKKEVIKVAQSCSPVLILGESGVGKELVAKAIYATSKRKDQPYCISNAAGGNSELVDSRYFGHLKGAFTNAEKDQAGLFQSAEKGTLFIDEIGNMPISTQQKLLRAIEYNQIEPIGATRSITVDVRILAATHKNLHKAIKKGKFQEDLYHRLSALVIEIPALNDRMEDIPLLAEYISHKICLEEDFELKVLSPEVINLLMEVNWKGGNVRLLANFLRSAIVDAGKDADVLQVRNFNRILRDRQKITG